MTAILLFCQLVGYAVILSLALCSMNRMGRRTRVSIRLAIAGMAIGAFGGLVAIVLYNYVPSVHECAIVLGLAVGMLVNQRHGRCPCALLDLRRRDHHPGGVL